jgi:phospholipase C
MHALFTKAIAAVSLGVAGVAACTMAARADDDDHRGHRRDFDRVFVIVMENHGFDQVIGKLNSTETAQLTPFTTQLALKYGLETFYFGVTHPSLPNYLPMIAGDFFGVQDDAPSCFASDVPNAPGCHKFDTPTLVDQLEKKNISWETLQESLPGVGSLVSRFPATGPTLYAQKHNPFLYFTSVATDPARLAKIKPFDLAQLKTELNNPYQASRFIYIVPNQCNDEHGTSGCSDDATALANGDAFLAQTVPAIINSPAFTNRSALFITWDEDDFSTNLGCCGQPGGGHVATIVVTKQGKPIKSAAPTNHYSLLATIEDGFDLPRLGNAKNATPLWDVFPSSSF